MRRREEVGETAWVWRSGEEREAETVGREEWKWSMRVPWERMEFRDSVVTKIGDEAIGDKGREGLLGTLGEKAKRVSNFWVKCQ